MFCCQLTVLYFILIIIIIIFFFYLFFLNFFLGEEGFKAIPLVGLIVQNNTNKRIK